jgi:cytochrome c-type biogenesis protein
MAEIAAINIGSAFAAGIVSFLSPCVLPLVPGYVSYVAGGSLDDLTERASARTRLNALVMSGCFVLGFTAVFVALGASASALGEFLLVNKVEFGYVAGAIIIVFGLYLTGLLKLPFLSREARFISRLGGGHPAAAGVLGMAFAFGWTPCIGPMLGAILAVSATQGTAGDGALLLAIYSLGLGVPFLVAAGFTGFFLRRLKAIRKVSRPFQIGAGAILVVMGIAMITGHLNDFGVFLLNAFPGLARIG